MAYSLNPSLKIATIQASVGVIDFLVEFFTEAIVVSES